MAIRDNVTPEVTFKADGSIATLNLGFISYSWPDVNVPADKLDELIEGHFDYYDARYTDWPPTEENKRP